MNLIKLYKKFDSRCRGYEQRVCYLYQKRGTLNNWQFNHLTETLISNIWLTWSQFCRNLFLLSCRGTVARDSSTIAPRPGDNSWKRIGYEASQGIRGSQITNNGHNRFKMQYELTWGDVDKFLQAVQCMRPANATTLLTAFGIGNLSIKDMQKVRNTFAHKNVETMHELRRLRLSYSFSQLTTPSDIVWVTSRNSNSIAVEDWLFHINLVADNATATN